MGILDVQHQESDGMAVLKDTAKPLDRADEVTLAAAVCALIGDKFNLAKLARLVYEQQWMRNWRNFRGVYGPDVRFTETEKSNVFVKITKTKTLAAIGQVLDVLLASGKFPLTVEATEKPEGAAETVTVSAKVAGKEDIDFDSPYGYFGDGKEWKPGSTLEDLVGPLLAEKMRKASLMATPGPPVDPNTGIEIHPAEQSAKQMEKTILDQIEESDGLIHLCHVVFEQAVLGTGCMVGPFTVEKTYHRWTPDTETGAMQYDPVIKDVPKLAYSSIWYEYPDPEAVHSNECTFRIKRHGYTSTKLRALKNRPGFRAEVIEYILENFNPDYNLEWFEQELKGSYNTNVTSERYEALEYWGMLDKELCEKFGIPIPKDMVDQKDVQVNVWICCNQIIRLILNPFIPARVPALYVPFEINPYCIWGVGVPENMDDCQTIMNGHARMAIDNLALSGNAVFEMDETYLVNGEDTRMFPGRVFRRQGGPPGQSIFMLQFPNTTNENMQMFDKFRQLADEATGIPSYSHGQTGVTGTTRTSSGMSMLMSAAAINIKNVLRNIDLYLIKPTGEAFFAWNMQFNDDLSIKGDLEIKARGTASLMLKEVRSQRMLMFMQVASNPTLAPFVKWPKVLYEFAKDMEIDPDKLINNMEEAKLQSLIMGSMQTNMGGGAPPSPDGQGPSDTQGSGNATIGTGTPQPSGTEGFSASGSGPQGKAPPQAGGVQS